MRTARLDRRATTALARLYAPELAGHVGYVGCAARYVMTRDPALMCDYIMPASLFDSPSEAAPFGVLRLDVPYTEALVPHLHRLAGFYLEAKCTPEEWVQKLGSRGTFFQLTDLPLDVVIGCLERVARGTELHSARLVLTYPDAARRMCALTLTGMDIDQMRRVARVTAGRNWRVLDLKACRVVWCPNMMSMLIDAFPGTNITFAQ